MKFVCLKCEAYMAFEKVEAGEEGRLGITFGCSSCSTRFSMVTNPGETQLVSSLGVTLGGRTAPHSPLEMTRATMKGETAATSTSMAAYLSARASETGSAAAVGASATADPMAGCPFSSRARAMMQGTGAAPAPASPTASQDGAAASAPAIELAWTAAAQEQMDRLPSYVRHVLTKSVEEYAGKHGFALITPDVMSAAKRGQGGIEWATEAVKRIDNLPDFIRPMARQEIERLARACGATTVTGEVMDQAKEAFSKLS